MGSIQLQAAWAQCSPYTKAQKTIGGASLGGFSRPTPNKVPNVGSSTSVLKRLLPESSFLLLSLQTLEHSSFFDFFSLKRRRHSISCPMTLTRFFYQLMINAAISTNRKILALGHWLPCLSVIQYQVKLNQTLFRIDTITYNFDEKKIRLTVFFLNCPDVRLYVSVFHELNVF